MGLEAFFLSDTNPNDNSGGGGCACCDEKVSSCEGPFCIFPNVETESMVSPFYVLGAKCLRAAAKALNTGEPLAAGEKAHVTPRHVESTAEDDGIPEV